MWSTLVSITILQCAKEPVGLAYFAAHTNTTAAKQNQIPGDEPEQGIDD